MKGSRTEPDGCRPRTSLHRGLLVDFGGVLTTDVFASFADFCRAEGLDPTTVRDAFRSDPEGRRLLEELECGRLEEPDFEAAFAALIGARSADGLIDRLFGGMAEAPEMVAAVAAAKAAGIRTGLLSNSWGHGRYDRSRFPELFDVVVISGEEGVRKPDPAIYALAVERMGLPAEEIVFVDDLPHNLKPAQAIGMATVLHRSAPETIAQLEELLGYAAGSAVISARNRSGSSPNARR